MLHYIGSKLAIGNRLITTIKSDAPQATTFIDLFCGGGNMLYFAAKEYKTLFANDYNIALIKTLKYVFTENFYKEINDFNGRYYQFIPKRNSTF